MFTVEKKPTKNQYNLHGNVVAIVLHTTLGAYNGAVSWLRNLHGQNPNSSAHVVFSRTGQIAQLAEFNRGTWHAGGVRNPSQRAKNVLPKYWSGRLKNPNRYTIGLEVASGYDVDRDGVLETWEKAYTPTQIKATSSGEMPVILCLKAPSLGAVSSPET